jgi:hypothetical protein
MESVMQSRMFAGFIVVLIATGGMSAQLPKVSEQTIQLERFGFRTGSCESRQSVQFLDAARLVLSAPTVGVCDKSTWSSALKTQLTVIDLQGSVLATKTRPDTYAVKAGPIGFAAVCSSSAVELVSADLNTVKVISSRSRNLDPCFGIEGLSPSRTAISIRDFGDAPKSFARHRLFNTQSEHPIAEQQFEQGQSLAGITDSGYAVCATAGFHGCERLTVGGSAWKTGPLTGVPLTGSRGLFLSSSQLLLNEGKALMSLSSNGQLEQLIDLHGFQPPHLDTTEIEISAATPRRILYLAKGCYIGDFDDCYAFSFGKVTVFDPQTHQSLFKKRVGGNATALISPDGHTVVVLDKTNLKIYKIP